MKITITEKKEDVSAFDLHIELNAGQEMLLKITGEQDFIQLDKILKKLNCTCYILDSKKRKNYLFKKEGAK